VVADTRNTRSRIADIAAAVLIVATVTGIGLALGVLTGFPKGTDAYAHLTRLRFVAEHFPRHEWLYAWSAGMPTFETYPELPYLALAPVSKFLGAPVALDLMAFAGLSLLGLGLYGTVRTATGSPVAGLVAALGAIGSMATWTWIVHGGVYARVLAAGLAACGCWAAARWLGGGGRVAFAMTAVLLAAAIASHQFIGAVFAFGVGVATLAHPGPARLRRAATLALATFLLASPAIVPPLVRYGGFASAFLGLERQLLTSPPTVLVDPRHLGVALVAIVVVSLLAAWPLRRAVVLLLGALVLWLGYLFAPGLGIPSRLYYVTGIDPFTATFLIAISAALVGGFALGLARGAPVPAWRRDGAAVVATALIALNLWLGPSAVRASDGYPRIEDASARASIEDLARRTIVVNGEDLAHRFLPAIASESVWFSYVYAKPQLRDYYGTGVLHPDWLAWVNAAVYTPPFRAGRFHAALDWFAVDSFSVFDDPNFTGNLDGFNSDAALRLVATSDPPAFRQYAVRDPSAIWRPTNARLLIVVGDRDEYDTIARMTLERVARPGSLIPIWWQDTVDRLPIELVDRAHAIVVEDGRFGDRAAAERILGSYANGGGRVLLDAQGAATALSTLWPVEAATDEAIPEWRLRSTSNVRVEDFAPARYDGGPWGAPVGTALRADARAILEHDGRPLVAEMRSGAGAVVWVGGNLFYHSKSYGNDAEAAFLVDLLGPLAMPRAAAGAGEQLDPERVTIRASDASGAFVSASYHPKWTGRWSDGSARAVYYAGPGLMYVPLLPGEGTLTLEFGRGWVDYGVWPLVLGGVLLCAWPLVERRRRGG
jgi:hypothetical protein